MTDPNPEPPLAQSVVTPSSRTRVADIKDSLGVQAAKFSLYTPLAVLLLGCATSAMRDGNAASNGGIAKDDHAVSVALAWFNVALMVVGFLLGVFALISIRRFGAKGILYRSLAGIVINGALISLVAMLFWPIVQGRAIGGRIVGTWHVVSSPSLTPGMIFDVSFRADKTFDFTVAAPGRPATFVSGTYQYAPGNRGLAIDVSNVANGDTKMVGEHIVLGRVLEVDDDHLRLGTEKGDEVYDRR